MTMIKKFSYNAAGSSAEDDNESDEVNDSRTIEGNYTQGNFCSSSRVNNNTLDLTLDIVKPLPIRR